MADEALFASVEIYNVESLKKKLNNLGKDKRKIINKESRESLRPMLAAAKRAAPVGRTKLTKKSLTIRAIKKSRVKFGANVLFRNLKYEAARKKGLTKKKTSNSLFAHAGSWKIFYAQFVELGTERIQARHWMKGVAKRMGKGVQRDFLKRIVKHIRELAGKPTQLTLFDKFK